MSDKKKKITNAICECAKSYKEKLAGRTFLYVLENGSFIEVMFLKRNFKHLTGVESPLHAEDFYRKATRSELGISQVWFTSSHPYRLAKKKIQKLRDLSEMAVRDLFVLEDITTATRLYRFGTTDLNVTLCLDEDSNNSYLVPTSLRTDDCFSKSNNVYSVTRIYSKRNGETIYTNLLYSDGSEHSIDENLKAMIE